MFLLLFLRRAFRVGVGWGRGLLRRTAAGRGCWLRTAARTGGRRSGIVDLSRCRSRRGAEEQSRRAEELRRGLQVVLHFRNRAIVRAGFEGGPLSAPPVTAAPAAGGGAAPAALPVPGVAPAGAASPASERGTGAFAAGVAPFSTRSTPTLLEPTILPMMLLLAARTISGALTCLGSTSVGSPTLVASVTSGPLRKFSISLPKCPIEPRLAISALSSAMAASAWHAGSVASSPATASWRRQRALPAGIG